MDSEQIKGVFDWKYTKQALRRSGQILDQLYKWWILMARVGALISILGWVCAAVFARSWDDVLLAYKNGMFFAGWYSIVSVMSHYQHSFRDRRIAELYMFSVITIMFYHTMLVQRLLSAG